MADWDADSRHLLANLRALGERVVDDAQARRPLSSKVLRSWQQAFMQGLEPPHGEPFGVFRGEPELAAHDVVVGDLPGVPSDDIAEALRAFDATLARRLADLDAVVPPTQDHDALTEDQLLAILLLCAWAHGEWVRIHPLPNGNGHTARILVNAIALRYGLPAFMRLRPRPGAAYGQAARAAMLGRWQASLPLFVSLYRQALDEE